MPFLTDLGPHVSTFRASADATPNRSVEEDARQLPPLNITVGWSIQGYITATVNDELKKIFVYEDELTPREIAEKFVERHGLAGDDPAAALVAGIEEARAVHHRLWFNISSATTAEELDGMVASSCGINNEYAEVVGQDDGSFRDHDGRFNVEEACFSELIAGMRVRVAALRWRVACKARGLQHTFDPPFFDHYHDAAGASSAVIFQGILLGDFGFDATDRRFARARLASGRPLKVLEVGSFEGSSATWLAQHLLVHHPDSRLVCVDNWAEANYLYDDDHGKAQQGDNSNAAAADDDDDDDDDSSPRNLNSNDALNPLSPKSIEEKMVASLGGRKDSNGKEEGKEAETDNALSRFKHNLARTPGGDRVVGVKAADSGTALAAILGRRIISSSSWSSSPSSSPSSDGIAVFDLVFIDGGHKSDEVLQDAVLCWPLLKPGGVMVFDDYGGRASKTRKGIDAFLSAYEPLLTVVWSSYILFVTKNGE